MPKLGRSRGGAMRLYHTLLGTDTFELRRWRGEEQGVLTADPVLITLWTWGCPLMGDLASYWWKCRVCLSFQCHHRTIIYSEQYPLAFPGRDWTVKEIKHHLRGLAMVACSFILNANETVAQIINCWGILHFQSVLGHIKFEWVKII